MPYYIDMPNFTLPTEGNEVDVPAGSKIRLDTSGVPDSWDRAAGTRQIFAANAPLELTIATLTAGSIAQASPSIGDTLTVTGSNASGSATYQWQESEDGSTDWANISGATSASYDTTSLTEDQYVRRGVSDGAQGPVYTAAVQVSAASAFTEYAVDFQGTVYSEKSADLGTDTRYSLFVISVEIPTLNNEEILRYNANSPIIFAANGQLNIIVRDSGGGQSSLTSSTDFLTAAAGQRLSGLIQTTDDGGTGTRIKMWSKIGSGSWVEEFNATRARPNLDFSGGYFAIGGDGSSDTYSAAMYGLAVYTDGNIGSGFDIGTSTDRDAFFNADGTLVPPATGNALVGVSPRLDTRGLDVTAMNAGTNNGAAGDFDTVNGTYIAG